MLRDSSTSEGEAMKIIEIHENQLKAVTLFLIDKEIIFHPTISPTGCPDFTGEYGRKNILIIDRNIMTKLVEFCRTGELHDVYIRKIISALLFWAEFNNVQITSGLALNEYAIAKGVNAPASLENNIFLKMFDQYSPEIWLDIFEDKKIIIPLVKVEKTENYEFKVENEHYLMHLSEVIYLFRLYMNTSLEPYQKVMKYISWVNDNQLFCAYSVTYACMLFSAKVKPPKVKLNDDFDYKLKKCSNQAWDLSYLSFWSTLYWNEEKGDTNFLFGTMDVDLKRIFINTHDTSTNLFIRFFGEKGNIIQSYYQKLIDNRVKPTMTNKKIRQILDREKKALSNQTKI